MSGPWLVTGVSGLLGSNALRVLGKTRTVIGTARRPPADAGLGVVPCDLTGDGAVRDLVERVAPGVILHCAALASIEACEADPRLAGRLNAELPAVLAAEAAAARIPFVAISTDAVFEGRSGGPHREDDEPAPVTTYARTKLAGERATLDANPRALVARVNFYGWSPSGRRGLAEFFHTRLAQSLPTPGFTDVTVSTMYVRHLVETLDELVTCEASGLLHVAASEPTTKYDFGRRLAAAFGFDPDLVLPDESGRHLQVARGQHLALDTDRAAQVVGHGLADQASGVASLRAEREAGAPQLLARFAPQDGTVVHHEDR